MHKSSKFVVMLLALVQWIFGADAGESSPELLRIAVVPHIQSSEMRYRREPDRSLGAWVQLFLANNGDSSLRLSSEGPVRLRGKTPEQLLRALLASVNNSGMAISENRFHERLGGESG